MSKDPAFLFYSTDFYEGTRTMLPEERACFIDLMIYQHQRGFIPNDIKRVLLYCNGINEATLIATLEAKFKLTDKGWVNEKLEQVILERIEFSNKQSLNGTVGQFWKKAKAILSKSNYSKLKDLLYNKSNNEIFEIIKDKEINEAMLIAMLQALLKHLEDEDENENINKDTIEGVQGEKEPKVSKSKYADFVLMLPQEYDKLKTEFGEQGVNRLVEILNNYKGSKGKQYKSDYLAIRNWVVTRYNEEKNKPTTASPKNVNQYWENVN